MARGTLGGSWGRCGVKLRGTTVAWKAHVVMCKADISSEGSLQRVLQGDGRVVVHELW